jgi:hypothetical protein
VRSRRSETPRRPSPGCEIAPAAIYAIANTWLTRMPGARSGDNLGNAENDHPGHVDHRHEPRVEQAPRLVVQAHPGRQRGGMT